MSINIQDAFRQAALGFGPLAEALIRDRPQDFLDEAEFAPFFPILRDDLVDFSTRLDALLDTPVEFKVESNAQALGLTNLIRSFAYDKANAAQAAPVPSGVPVVAPPQAGPKLIAPTPCGSNAGAKYAGNFKTENNHYHFTCGAVVATFQEAMAHKVLNHGYHHHKYTLGWAKTVLGPNAQVVPEPVKDPSDPDPEPHLRSVVEEWKPELNLDLRDLDFTHEASRFAVGEEGNARFYFIRHLDRKMMIKGRFPWTKFGHYFTSITLDQDDYVVRKMAGDTKEWIGLQSSKGVWKRQTQTRTSGYYFPDLYVGKHEEDIAAILKDPHGARIKYGLLIGACGYCGKKLTDPESRKRGIGPDCWERRGRHVHASHTAVTP